MKKFLLLILIPLIFGCSPKMSIDWTKEGYTDRVFSKVVVIGISDNMTSRAIFEKTAVSKFADLGIDAVEGLQYFPMEMSEQESSDENIIKIIKKNNIDAIITMSMIDETEGQRYEPGESITYADGYYRVGKHIYTRYRTVSTPGYYVDTKSFLIEAMLFDLKGELNPGDDKVVWTGQSTLTDPSSLKSAALSFTNRMVKHLVEGEIVKAK